MDVRFQIVKHNGRVTLGVPGQELKNKPYLVRAYRDDKFLPGWHLVGFARNYRQAKKILHKYLINHVHNNKELVILYDLKIDKNNEDNYCCGHYAI